MRKLMFFLLLIPFGVSAQSTENIFVRETPKGLFVYLGNLTDINQTIELQRKIENSANFEKIATLIPPKTIEEVRENILKSRDIFIPQATPTTQDLEKLWANCQDKTLSKLIVSIPQLSYLFNRAYLDASAVLGKKYQYRIVSANKIYLSKEYIYAKNSYFPEINEVTFTPFDKQIKFQFSFPYNWSSIIRFQTARKNITQSSTLYKEIDPLISFSSKDAAELKDTSLLYHGSYNYRIKIIDIFYNTDTTNYYFNGNNIPAGFSTEVKNVTIKSAPNSRAVQIKWELTNAQYVQNVKLFKSRKYEGPYNLIHNFSPTEKSFIDPIEVANELYFYKFEVENIFGQENHSIRYQISYDGDNPPSISVDFNLKVTRNGPELSFAASDAITRGFYVYRRRGIQEDFLQISPIILAENGKASFIDSTRLSANSGYYYTVKAESDTYQKSEFSDTLYYSSSTGIRSGDLKPPHDISISFSEGKARISWENVNDENPEVLAYSVFRKSDKQTDFKNLTPSPLSFDKNMFIDSTFDEGNHYQYIIVSSNDKGVSGPQSLPVFLDLTGRFLLIPEETGYEKDQKSITLKWTGIDANRLKNIKIYRAEFNKEIKLLATLDLSKASFKDLSVKKGETYIYQVATTDLAGIEYKATPLVIQF